MEREGGQRERKRERERERERGGWKKSESMVGGGKSEEDRGRKRE